MLKAIHLFTKIWNSLEIAIMLIRKEGKIIFLGMQYTADHMNDMRYGSRIYSTSIERICTLEDSVAIGLGFFSTD